MPDAFDRRPAPAAEPAWHALPLLTPPHSAWPALQRALERRRTRRRQAGALFAAAAAIALAVGTVRWFSLPDSPPAELARVAPGAALQIDESAQMAALMQESAQLEALIAWSRNDDVETATAASLGVVLQQRIARVDLLLSRPDADPDALLPLWQDRVLRLRQLAGLQRSQQLLAANGDSDPGMPVLTF
jgi:hypothetical protein